MIFVMNIGALELAQHFVCGVGGCLVLGLGGDFWLRCVWYTLLLSMWAHGLVGATGGHFREICGQLDSCHVTTINKVSSKGIGFPCG